MRFAWKHFPRVLTGLLAAVLLACPALARAEITIEAGLGYEDAVAYLAPMPLRVRLRNTGADAELTVAVNLTRSAYEYDRSEYPVTLAGSAALTLTMPVNITYKQAAYTVEVLENGEMVASAELKPRKTLSPDTLLVGLLADQPQALRYLNISSANDTLMRGESWQTLALTADTFPDSAEMLRAFRILAVDGFDVNLLSRAQRDALAQWLREGGIVLLGGGATATAAYKGFAALTGIRADALWQDQRVDTALLGALADGNFATGTNERMNGSVTLCGMRGSAHPVAELNGKTLIDRCAVGQGAVYTCAFSLSERPVANWPGMSGYWQRLLLTADQALYVRTVRELSNYYDLYGNSQYIDTWVLRLLPLENSDPVWLAAALAAFFALLGGLGSYLILKKLDKREWMWVTVPALSLLCAALMLLLRGGMRLSDPVSATYSVVQIDPDGKTETSYLSGIACAGRGPVRVSASGSRLRAGEDNRAYYQDDDEQAENAQPLLRYVYSYGDEGMSLTLPQDTAWAVRPLYSWPAAQPDYPIRAELWWAKNGLRGEIRNDSSLALEEGWLLTTLGYCRVPALLPGQKADVALIENPNRKSDPSMPEVFEGELIADGSVGIYTVADAALGSSITGDSLSDPNALRRGLANVCRSGWGDINVYHYVAFSDQAPAPLYAVDGETVERAAFMAVIDVTARFRAVGEDGIVRLSRGMVPAFSAEKDASGAPRGIGEALESYAYFQLRDEPVVCFHLGGIDGLDLSRLTIGKARVTYESYGGAARLHLYDAAAGQWVEATGGGVLDPALLRRCLDGEGRLFVRMSANAGGTGGEIYNPALTLEGRVD